MIIFVDFDGTIYNSRDGDYYDLFVAPNQKLVDYMREMIEDEHNEVVIYSCRSNPKVCDTESEEFMIKYLKRYDIPYTRIERDKPLFDVLIDDRVMNISDL